VLQIVSSATPNGAIVHILLVGYAAGSTVPTGVALPQSTQSAGPVRFLIFCSISISLLASLVAGRSYEYSDFWFGDPSVLLGHRSRECTPGYLSTGISNLLQSAQAEVVLGHLSTYLVSWGATYVKKNSEACCAIAELLQFAL
jgi:hypothetical protein